MPGYYTVLEIYTQVLMLMWKALHWWRHLSTTLGLSSNYSYSLLLHTPSSPCNVHSHSFLTFPNSFLSIQYFQIKTENRRESHFYLPGTQLILQSQILPSIKSPVTLFLFIYCHKALPSTELDVSLLRHHCWSGMYTCLFSYKITNDWPNLRPNVREPTPDTTNDTMLCLQTGT